MAEEGDEDIEPRESIALGFFDSLHELWVEFTSARIDATRRADALGLPSKEGHASRFTQLTQSLEVCVIDHVRSYICDFLSEPSKRWIAALHAVSTEDIIAAASHWPAKLAELGDIMKQTTARTLYDAHNDWFAALEMEDHHPSLINEIYEVHVVETLLRFY